jgi:hypothetical protein
MMWRWAKVLAFVLSVLLWGVCDRAEHYSRKLTGWLEDQL